MIFISQDFQTHKKMQSRHHCCPYICKKATYHHNQAIPVQKYYSSIDIWEKSCHLVYNNILRKQKHSIRMNYCIDILHNDQNNRKTSDSEHSEHFLLDRALEKLAKAQQKSRVKMSSFSWSKTEEKKYINFLKTNAKLFSLSPKQRKEIKINVMMSYAIKTRTSAQCHSHHQKMILKHQKIQNIIESHLHLFDKESKIQVKIEPIEDIESKEISLQSQEEIILEQERRAEPLWWRYLDLMGEQQESLWQHSYFFSQ